MRFSGHRFSSNQKPHGLLSRFQWIGIPVSLGVACVGFLHFRRVLKKERVNPASSHPMTWQLVMFLQIPTRTFSRLWGSLMEKEINSKLRVPLFGLYKVTFGCNMDEVEESELKNYDSFKSLFIRKLKEGVRPIDTNHHLVSPVDGKVLHYGIVDKDSIEQVKGVRYSMSAFLGPGLVENWTESGDNSGDSRLYHVVLYLSPGDCHHFYSPADWQATLSRHLPGELLTVAPWAAQSMPGLFALNERLILNGNWRYGTFSFAAVGAYNVGSIAIDIDEKIKTNQKGRYVYGTFLDKDLKTNEGGGGVEFVKGNHIGVFNMGSSIVLIFEAPRNFEFVVHQNQTMKIGEPLGRIL